MILNIALSLMGTTYTVHTHTYTQATHCIDVSELVYTKMVKAHVEPLIFVTTVSYLFGLVWKKTPKLTFITANEILRICTRYAAHATLNVQMFIHILLGRRRAISILIGALTNMHHITAMEWKMLERIQYKLQLFIWNTNGCSVSERQNWVCLSKIGSSNPHKFHY